MEGLQVGPGPSWLSRQGDHLPHQPVPGVYMLEYGIKALAPVNSSQEFKKKTHHYPAGADCWQIKAREQTIVTSDVCPMSGHTAPISIWGRFGNHLLPTRLRLNFDKQRQNFGPYRKFICAQIVVYLGNRTTACLRWDLIFKAGTESDRS
ncbi:hypothetical protein K438DRAFT_1751030 [Mycena galopus ATCC 62051]|nr:hypothetical protein K438DRAFT_1751030 [Mycena galopus ATCC 62051]